MLCSPSRQGSSVQHRAAELCPGQTAQVSPGITELRFLGVQSFYLRTKIVLSLFESHLLPNTSSLRFGRGNNKPRAWPVPLAGAGGLPVLLHPFDSSPMACSCGWFAKPAYARPPSESSSGKAASLGSACALPEGHRSWPSMANTRTLKCFCLQPCLLCHP